MGTHDSPRLCGGKRNGRWGASPHRPFAKLKCSAKRVTTRTRTAGVGVVDREALLLDRVREVDLRTVKVRNRHLVHDHLDAVIVLHGVAVERALVEVELVDQARAATRLNGQTQTKVIATLLRKEALDLRCSRVGNDHAVRRSLSCGIRHMATPSG